MIHLPSDRFDSAYESLTDGRPAQHRLSAPLKTRPPGSLHAEVHQLLDEAQKGDLTPASLREILLAKDADGDSLWHEVFQQITWQPLLQLSHRIASLIESGRLDATQACALFRASDPHEMPVLHRLASKSDTDCFGEFATLLLELHAKGRLQDTDLASVLLQDWHGETVVQRALLGGCPGTVDGALSLLARGLKAGAITEADVCHALAASRFPGFPARGRPASPGPAPTPLQLAFSTATVPTIEAVLKGVEALRRYGGMSTDRLRDVMEPVFQSTGSAVRQSSSAMAGDLAQAHALVARARAGWSAAEAGERTGS